jgi:hypothetical protein
MAMANIYIYIYIMIYEQCSTHIHHTDGQTEKQTDLPFRKPADRQTDKQTGMPFRKPGCMLYNIHTCTSMVFYKLDI